jgi:pimeloyl-ACP methyl ester carboxylesterase
MLKRTLSLAVVLLAHCSGKVAVAQDDKAAGAPPNWETPTFGGLQYWADELVYYDFRIQRHVSTGHHRLLDGRDERYAWGTFEHCRAKLEEIKKELKLAPLPKHVVVTLHGMARTRHSMNGIAEHLRKEGKYTVLTVGYPSLQESIPQNAATFGRLIGRLDGVETIDVVGYSMGNIVTRHWLGDVAAEAAKRNEVGAVDAQAANGGGPEFGIAPTPKLPKLRRYVMLGPPNQGAQRAKLWAESSFSHELFKLVVGEGGEQLGPKFHEIKDRLATPDCEFGILAGGKGDGKGWHDGIPGDDDGTVGVEETKLAGATDFAVVKIRHTWLITEKDTHSRALNFLNYGYFTSPEVRSPLPKPAQAGAR